MLTAFRHRRHDDALAQMQVAGGELIQSQPLGELGQGGRVEEERDEDKAAAESDQQIALAFRESGQFGEAECEDKRYGAAYASPPDQCLLLPAQEWGEISNNSSSSQRHVTLVSPF